MFPSRMFPDRLFAPRYFAKHGAAAAILRTPRRILATASPQASRVDPDLTTVFAASARVDPDRTTVEDF